MGNGELKGRVAVVTGGNGGIGLGMAEGLAANSVASFADGSLVATVLFMPGTTFAGEKLDCSTWAK